MTDLESKKAILADELMSAAGAVRRAVQQYREIAGMSGVLDASDLVYKPSTALIDTKDFTFNAANSLHPFRSDGVLQAAAGAEDPFVEMLLLEASPHWQDRIRAKVMHLTTANDITLPDGFPCIYEPADSPKNERVLNPRPLIWVASPDEGMLRELLPLYRELWESYENQWPSTPNRTFEVGRLNGVAPYGVFRPGATAADVIGRTMLTHDGMYARAPEHLKQMHPRHKDWTTPRPAARKGTSQ